MVIMMGIESNGVAAAHRPKARLDRKVLVRAMGHYLPGEGVPRAASEIATRLVAFFGETYGDKLVEIDGGEPEPALTECDACGYQSPYDLAFGALCPFCGVGDEEEKDEAAEDVVESKAVVVAKPRDVVQAGVTEVQLDEKVEAIHRGKVEGVSAAWRVGKLITEIRGGQLWKLRRDENGLPRFKTFEAFCLHELNLTAASVYRFDDVAGAFTEPEAAKLGTSKLKLIVMLPAEDREELKKKIAEGATHREIAKAASEKKQRAKKEGKPLAETKAPAGREGGRKLTKLTIPIEELLRKRRVEAYCKPTNTSNFSLEELTRAKTLKDQPLGMLQLSPKVMLMVTLAPSASGELEFVFVGRVKEKEKKAKPGRKPRAKK
jgi:hypothetical protein